MTEAEVVRTMMSTPDYADNLARVLMEKRGHVVVGFRPEFSQAVGHRTQRFGQAILRGFLVIEQETSRDDWEEQALVAFGNRHPAWHLPPIDGEQFYRCRYEEGDGRVA